MTEFTLTFIVLLLSALSHKATVATKKMSLDDAPNAVDDLYTGCRDEMLQTVTGGLLTTELNATPKFNKSWPENNSCTKLIPQGAKIHTEALVAFGHNKKFRKTFNAAVQNQGGNASVYKSDFLFKSLHFLLTDSLRLLKAEECKTVYHASEDAYVADVGAKVRFGRFITAESKAIDMFNDNPGGTHFIINSCSAVNLYENACAPDDAGDWVISPAEMFTVESIEKKTEDEDEFTEIHLKSLKMNSYHDCYYYSRSMVATPSPTPAGSSNTKWLGGSMFGLMALSLFASLSIASDQL